MATYRAQVDLLFVGPVVQGPHGPGRSTVRVPAGAEVEGADLGACDPETAACLRRSQRHGPHALVRWAGQVRVVELGPRGVEEVRAAPPPAGPVVPGVAPVAGGGWAARRRRA